jgi:transcriptional regulator GlxA family with amidase domain
MKATRRVAILIYDGIQSLDATGPFEAFAIANRLSSERQSPPARPPYAIELIAPAAGVITASSGIRLVADRAYRAVRGRLDTLVVAGGEVQHIMRDKALLRWLVGAARRTRRMTSVCTGAFVLAEAGLLRGRSATTHWASTRRLAQRYPDIKVEPDAIFVRDGHFYTAAGVTSGIDLALALIEDDLGHSLALAVARRMVVFLKRPGGQSQFSSHLEAQAVAPGPLKDLPEWIVANLRADLSVEHLAARVAMSPRHFARVFRIETGGTPAKFVERARLDSARRDLENGALALEDVANRSGFASAEHLRRAFTRQLHIVPIDYRRRFQRRHRAPFSAPAAATEARRFA